MSPVHITLAQGAYYARLDWLCSKSGAMHDQDVSEREFSKI